MKKRLVFFNNILNESMERILPQICVALKEDCKKGDFVSDKYGQSRN